MGRIVSEPAGIGSSRNRTPARGAAFNTVLLLRLLRRDPMLADLLLVVDSSGPARRHGVGRDGDGSSAARSHVTCDYLSGFAEHQGAYVVYYEVGQGEWFPLTREG